MQRFRMVALAPHRPLGDVMKESAQAALTLVKSRAADPRVPSATFDDIDIHLHIPAGAIPKDGPSAGVAMFLP
jgi:ATP-dependent Lon protease